MKKLLIGVLVCLSLVGCGKDKPVYDDETLTTVKEVVEEKLPSKRELEIQKGNYNKEKDLPEKREGWDYTVEGLESASSCEQMEGYINYSLRDGRKDEDDIKILNWKIDQVDIVLAENEVEENLLNYFKAYRECCVNLLSAERDVEYQGEIAKLRMAEMFKNN